MFDSALTIVLAVLIIWFIVWMNSASGFLERDSTDSETQRSGLLLWVDRGTGCHYISASPFGQLTPRHRPDGTIYCEPVKSKTPDNTAGSANEETPKP
jgi:hypothetical protein